MYYIQSISSISPYPTFQTEDFLSGEMEKNDLVLHAVEPNYKDFIEDANIRRRMSRIVKMGVAAALDCIHQSDIKQPDAIITGTGLGCLADTEKFLNNIIENDEELLNPTAFIQSTFNTISAQIALILKNQNYNFTYVHRGFSFESALLDAMMLIKENAAQNALVGAIDELTPTSAHIMQRMGFEKEGIHMGEGAQFFMLSNAPSTKDYARINDLKTFLNTENEEIEAGINEFLNKNKISAQDIDFILFGSNGNQKNNKHYEEVQKSIFKDIPCASFKHICGEYPTASSFGLWCAANILKNKKIPELMQPSHIPNIFKRILVYNNYRHINHTLILLDKV